MGKILFFTSIPSPYRVDFFNALAKLCELEVVFEARQDPACHFNLYDESRLRFRHRFLSVSKSFREFIPSGVWQGLTSKCDRLVIHTYHTRTQSCLILLLKLLNKRYWFETDGGIVNHSESRLLRWVKRLLIAGAEGYFSPSRASDEYLTFYGADPKRIHRYSFTSISDSDIPDASFIAADRGAIRSDLGIDAQAPILLAVGQFIPRKGFDILLQAMAQLGGRLSQNSSHVLPHLYIVGGKPTDEYLLLRTQLGLDEQVHFVGYCSKTELSRYYRVADLFVHPTREDIWGLVINEAMAFGLPVITTDRCNAGLEILDHTDTTIVPAEDPVALADSMAELLSDDSLRADIGRRNLEYSRHHSIEQMAREHAYVLR